MPDGDVIIPNIEVIENGQRVFDPRVDPNVATFIMQSVNAAHTARMRKLMESQVPTGLKPYIVTVGPVKTTLDATPPWISCEITNTGPGMLTIWMNEEDDPLEENMIPTAQAIQIDMKFPIIEKLYLKSNTICRVKIHAKVGRAA
jgi:hypothetical protein